MRVWVAFVAASSLLNAANAAAETQNTSSSSLAETVQGGSPTQSPVARVRDYVIASGRNAQRPFIVIDKQRARMFVYSKDGKIQSDAPVLLGAAIGDHSAPGIGERRLSEIKPHEKTTPAGGFYSRPGRNLSGEDVIWLDYDAAVSIHRVRATNPAERRLERLDTATPRDNRISFGCINVPAQFYDRWVRPVFQAGGAWVYVIPETRSVDSLTAERLP